MVVIDVTGFVSALISGGKKCGFVLRSGRTQSERTVIRRLPTYRKLAFRYRILNSGFSGFLARCELG